MKDKIFEEALGVISDGQEELIHEKKVVYDKKTGQVSIKIPKDFALKKGVDQNTIFEIVLNPTEETLEKIKDVRFAIYPKEVKDDKGEKRT